MRLTEGEGTGNLFGFAVYLQDMTVMHLTYKQDYVLSTRSPCEMYLNPRYSWEVNKKQHPEITGDHFSNTKSLNVC